MANITTTSIDPTTGKTLYTTRAEGSAIPVNNIQTVKPLSLPQQPTDNTNYQGIVNGGSSILSANMPKVEESDLFSKYMSNLEAPPSTGSLYGSLYGQSNISGIEQDITSKQQAQTQAQKELDLLNAQLQGITAESTQANLQLETPTGQATDVTQRFLGRQQQEVNRQAAIKALPLQTQALAAQAKVSAAQGDVLTAQNTLKLAQDRLNTAFNIQSKDVENLYNYNKSVRDKVYEYATAQEKNQLDAKQKEEDRKYDMLKQQILEASDWSKRALENDQGEIAGKITALNPKSATYKQELQKLVSQIKIKENNPASYREWELAGKQTGTGMSYSEWLNQNNNNVTYKELANGNILALDNRGNVVNTIGGGVATGEGILSTPSGNSYDLSTYATDPNHISAINRILTNMGKLNSPEDVTNYISQTSGSPLSYDIIKNASEKYGIGWEELLGLMKQESGLATSNVSMTNNNPAGITWSQSYQNNHPEASKGSARPQGEGGNYVKFKTLQDGVNATAEQLANRKTEVGQYSDVLKTILASGKFTKEQAKAVQNAINSGEDPIATIKNQAKNIAGQTESTKITGFEVASSQIDDIDRLLKEYYSKGGQTGIFKGNYEKAINNLGNVDNPELVGLAVQIAAALQIYRNAVSGTAYSVQEGNDIAAIFPGIDKSEGLNSAIINGRKQAFKSTIDASYRSILGSAYDKIQEGSNTRPATSFEDVSTEDFFNIPIPGTKNVQSNNFFTTINPFK